MTEERLFEASIIGIGAASGALIMLGLVAWTSPVLRFVGRFIKGFVQHYTRRAA